MYTRCNFYKGLNLPVARAFPEALHRIFIPFLLSLSLLRSFSLSSLFLPFSRLSPDGRSLRFARVY